MTIQTTADYYQNQVNKNKQIIQELLSKMTKKQKEDLIAKFD